MPDKQGEELMQLFQLLTFSRLCIWAVSLRTILSSCYAVYSEWNSLVQGTLILSKMNEISDFTGEGNISSFILNTRSILTYRRWAKGKFVMARELCFHFIFAIHNLYLSSLTTKWHTVLYLQANNKPITGILCSSRLLV